MENNINSALFSPLIGEQLSAVCFVQDYLQIDFDGCKLTTYTIPVIVISESNFMIYNELMYKNELCDFIAKKVVEVRYDESNFVEIIFSEYEKSIKIFLEDSVDNIYYSDTEGKWFVI